MAVTLGINVASGVGYCAVVDDGILREIEPYKLEAPADAAEADSLSRLAEEVERLIQELSITEIVVVATENNYSDTYSALTSRIGLETAILIAGARSDISAVRLSRPDIRSKLGIPMRGQLSDLCSQVITEKGRLWTKKRDVAALGALSRQQAR